MKNKLVNNFALKLLSVVLAVILWIVVMNVSDYYVQVQIDDIPVVQLNGDVLEELDKIYDVVEGNTVDIIVKGRRSLVSDLTATDFIATADLSTMSITNTVQIEVQAKRSNINEEVSINCINNIMSLNLEEKVKQQFTIKANVTGTPREGYAVNSSMVTPNIVTIEGPESVVNKITEVSVDVDVTNRKDKFDITGAIHLYDAYGESISIEKVQMNCSEATAELEVFPVKTVELEFKTVGTPYGGYVVNEIISEKKEVTLVGDANVLKSVDKIVIGDLSVSDLSEDSQREINLENYIPEGVKLVGTDKTVLVSIDIEPVKESSIMISEESIDLLNKQPGYDYSLSISGNLRVRLTGMEKSIIDLTIEDLAPYIDCSNYSVGEHDIKLLFKNQDDNVTYEVFGTITLEVSPKEEK